jgi:hypothetical protein
MQTNIVVTCVCIVHLLRNIAQSKFNGRLTTSFALSAAYNFVPVKEVAIFGRRPLFGTFIAFVEHRLRQVDAAGDNGAIR